MIGSDVQKFFVLKIQKGLIKNGFFGITRNPNYLGEILIYLSFGIVARSNFVYSTLCLIWVVGFGPRIITKDVSLSKKPDFAQYAENSYLLFPKFLSTDNQNAILYASGIFVGLFVYFLS
jgi:steroid 5-alpha reductase family enzyme